MGFKKYEEKVTSEVEKEEETKEIEEEKNNEELINSVIDSNALLEEEENKKEVTTDQVELTKKINDARSKYWAFNKKVKRINYIVTGVSTVLMVGVFILTLVFQNQYSRMLYLALGAFVLALVAMVVTTKVNKNKLQGKANDYINELFSLSAGYLYRDEKFTKVNYLSQNQLDDQVFINAHFYKNIKNTRSRNYVEVEYNGKVLTSVDIAGNILVKNRMSPMFLGRMYVYPNNYEGDKVIIAQLKGGQLSKPLDDIDDLKLVDGGTNSSYVVYTNDEGYKKVFNSKVLSTLRKFRIDKTLIDVIVSVRAGYTTIGIDYCDEFLNIPVESDFNINTLRRSEKDLELVLEMIDEINKK